MQKHSCQRRPINLSSGCWHGDCRTELGWMAQRAMRGHSRILQEPVTGKLEAATATAAARRRNTEKREREREEEKEEEEERRRALSEEGRRQRLKREEGEASNRRERGLRYRFLAVIQSTMVPYLTPLPPALTHWYR
ncbi:hypothetical protein K0M31_015100 [Melipona bicolor]|uniref:Uncharacterized protein n=1 Tax=Melipona bicolor TaxID=60889 RepID=A0AA40FG49_9HYME|nr:hypothetical protein K0M31_015100 [Melipona bicolor]